MQSLVCYKTLPVWKHDSIPTAFQQAHNTKQGTWAKLHILKGELDFAMLSEQGEVISNHHLTWSSSPLSLNLKLGIVSWHLVMILNAS